MHNCNVQFTGKIPTLDLQGTYPPWCIMLTNIPMDSAAKCVPILVFCSISICICNECTRMWTKPKNSQFVVSLWYHTINWVLMAMNSSTLFSNISWAWHAVVLYQGLSSIFTNLGGDHFNFDSERKGMSPPLVPPSGYIATIYPPVMRSKVDLIFKMEAKRRWKDFDSQWGATVKL